MPSYVAGGLSLRELLAFCKTLGLQPTPRALHRFAAAGRDKAASLSFAEFKALVAHLERTGALPTGAAAAAEPSPSAPPLLFSPSLISPLSRDAPLRGCRSRRRAAHERAARGGGRVGADRGEGRLHSIASSASAQQFS